MRDAALALGCFGVLVGGLVPPARAQETETPIPTLARWEHPAELMILGTFHFHNPGADYAQFEGIDVLTAERQREIAAVAAALAEFEPTKVAVERPLAEADSLKARYDRYRRGTYELTRNEVHQLGFRLASLLGHDRVYPVDYRKGMALDSLLAYAKEHQPGYAERFDAYIAGIVAFLDSLQARETIGANLRFMNQPENVRRSHEPYVVQAAVGAGDTYIGARVTGGWYERNLAIFGNLVRVAEPGERVLFIVGAGHAPILRHLVLAHPDLRLVEAVDYLP